MKKIPPPLLRPMAEVMAREVLHLSVTRWLATVLVALVVGAPFALREPWGTPPLPVPPSPMEPTVPLLEAAVDAGVPSFASLVMGRLPRPGPNQKRAGQCDPGRAQQEINGGCWVQTTTPTPCPEGKQWEHEGRCYLPVGPTVPPPSAGEPPPLSIADP